MKIAYIDQTLMPGVCFFLQKQQVQKRTFSRYHEATNSENDILHGVTLVETPISILANSFTARDARWRIIVPASARAPRVNTW
jgi:hypothetical protein